MTGCVDAGLVNPDALAICPRHRIAEPMIPLQIMQVRLEQASAWEPHFTSDNWVLDEAREKSV